jgi:CO/xanthine dehydrogenase FAD-binding subunit
VKPAPFTYHRPESRADVDALLAQYGTDAKILAGGQSLIPILNMRLASPSHIIDINHLHGEPDEPVLSDGYIEFGPLVRQETIERSKVVADRVPLLAATIEHVAHPAIRNRGTVVGSIAHADPAAELPAALVALGGTITARRTEGRREIHADDFFAGPLENSMAADEWAESVHWPVRGSGEGFGFAEFARRSGDYALCGVAAVVRGSNGSSSLTLAYLGTGEPPARLHTDGLPHETPPDEVIDEVVRDLIEGLEAGDDIHATATYRRWLARKLGIRAARTAWAGRHEETE